MLHYKHYLDTSSNLYPSLHYKQVVDVHLRQFTIKLSQETHVNPIVK